MKIHKDLLDLPTEEVEEELKARHEQKLVMEAREEKRQELRPRLKNKQHRTY